MTAQPTLPTTLTLAECQKFVDDLKTSKGWHVNNMRDEFLLMSEEVGEVANCIRHLTWPSKKSADQVTADLGDELVDVLNYTLSLATLAGVNLEEAFRRKNGELLTRTYVNVQNA